MWFRKAADQGYAPAQSILGQMYHDGQGVPQDYAQTAMWLRKAADQGNALAQGFLGAMYGDGWGVPRDYVLAYMWFNSAASRASDAALRDSADKGRDRAAVMMTPAQVAEAQRLAREWAPK
jgi:TPR repeat protein